MTKYGRTAELQKAFDAHQEKEAHGYDGINFRGEKKKKKENKIMQILPLKHEKNSGTREYFVLSQWLQLGATLH